MNWLSGRGRVVVMSFTLLAIAAIAPVTSVLAAVPQFGVKDQSFSGASTAPSGSKPESKLWYNDGIWWASMWNTSTSQFRIFKLNTAGTVWSDTGTVLDVRGSSHSDALWDGSKLYIASHDMAADSSHNTAGRPAYLYRLTYNSGSKTYSMDAGFPTTITTVATETLVIGKDSTGRIWATWTQNKKPVVAHTTTSNLTWGASFTPAITGTSLTSDDVSSLISYGGNRIGLMWSNQSSSHMYFSSHRDSDPDGTWTTSEAATTGTGSADDHVNLKTDAAGRIYAAVKTSLTSSSATLIQLLVRGSAGGWSAYRFGTVAESHTRPIVEIDEQAGVIHMYATGPWAGAASGQSGGTIYEKTSPISAISFPSGPGTPVIQDPGSADMNNASSTKQNVNSTTGLVVLGTNDTKKFYWHSKESLAGGTPPTAAFSGTPLAGEAGLTVNFTDLSTGAPTSWAWNFGDPNVPASQNNSSAQNSTHVYAQNGTYTVSLIATNASGSSPQLIKTGYITVAPKPTASFTATPPLSGPSPLTVAFTDTSTGAPTSWLWNFGDPTSGADNTSTLQNPSHTYAVDGTFSVSLTATNASGSTTATQDNIITVASPPVANFTATPTSGPASLSVQFTDTSTNNPTSWLWDFGDSATATEQSPSHTYTADGTYTVTLTATSGIGFDDETKIGYITVGDVPVADFTGTPTTGIAGMTVDFVDGSSNTPTTWLWDFGDSGTSAVKNPSHTYAADGKYTVKLTATNAAGTNTITKTDYIVVGTAPVADFTATNTSGSAPLVVAFSDASTNNPTSWSWNFGDPGSGTSNTSFVRNPSHTYSGGGTFTVTLTASNALGPNTATKIGFVHATSSAATLTLNPIADSHVSSSNLVGNYGTITTMKVREGDGSSANPNYRAYMKFDVSGVSGTVDAVTLRLFVTDASVNLASVYVVGDSTWTETGITYTNAPVITGSAVGTTQSAPAGAYVSITLVPSSVTPGTSPLTLALKLSATDSFIVSSREDQTNKPQLVVTFH